MRIRWLSYFAFSVVIVLSITARAQVYPSGPFTPGHTVRCQDGVCSVITDGGGAAAPTQAGQGFLTEFNVMGTACWEDGYNNIGLSPNGYHQLCVNPLATIDGDTGAFITYNSYGGANPLPLYFNINGTNIPFPPVATSIEVGTSIISGGIPNGLLYNAAGVLGNLATGNNEVLATNGSGIPGLTGTLPSQVQGNITTTGTVSGGTWASSISGATLGSGGLNLSGNTISGNGTLSGSLTFSGSNAYGTPASITLTNANGLPISGISGLGTGVATALGNAMNASGGLTTYGGTFAGTINGASLGASSLNLNGETISGNGTFSGTIGLAAGATVNSLAIAAISGSITNGHCVEFGSGNTIVDAGSACGSGGGGGSVTSVGWNINSTTSSGIFAVSSTPVTSSGTINLATSGTSGGVPYFSSSSIISSSGALTANALVIGGGAGSAPATTTTGTGVLTAIGNATNGTGGLVTYGGTFAGTISNGTFTGVVAGNPTATGSWTFSNPITGASLTPTSATCPSTGFCFPNGSPQPGYGVNTIPPSYAASTSVAGLTENAANILAWAPPAYTLDASIAAAAYNSVFALPRAFENWQIYHDTEQSITFNDQMQPAVGNMLQFQNYVASSVLNLTIELNNYPIGYGASQTIGTGLTLPTLTCTVSGSGSSWSCGGVSGTTANLAVCNYVNAQLAGAWTTLSQYGYPIYADPNECSGAGAAGMPYLVSYRVYSGTISWQDTSTGGGSVTEPNAPVNKLDGPIGLLLYRDQPPIATSVKACIGASVTGSAPNYSCTGTGTTLAVDSSSNGYVAPGSSILIGGGIWTISGGNAGSTGLFTITGSASLGTTTGGTTYRAPQGGASPYAIGDVGQSLIMLGATSTVPEGGITLAELSSFLTQDGSGGANNSGALQISVAAPSLGANNTLAVALVTAGGIGLYNSSGVVAVNGLGTITVPSTGGYYLGSYGMTLSSSTLVLSGALSVAGTTAIQTGASASTALSINSSSATATHGLQSYVWSSGFFGIEGIGETAGSTAVGGNATVSGTFAANFFDGAGNSCKFGYGSTSWTCSSDERLKADIKRLDPVTGMMNDGTPMAGVPLLDRMAMVEPADYGMAADATIRHDGGIAQDIQPSFPHMVTMGTDGYLAVDSNAPGWIAWGGVNMLYVRLKHDEDIIAQLEATLKGQR